MVHFPVSDYITVNVATPKRKRRTKRDDYNYENLQKAIETVKAGTMTSRQAASFFNVPRSTVYVAATKAKYQGIDFKLERKYECNIERDNT